jgi:hypothetical protein
MPKHDAADESPTSLPHQDSNSSDSNTGTTDSSIVMAESIAHDVVKEAQSVGSHHQPSDDIATPSNDYSAGNGQATQSQSSSSPYNADNRDGNVVANGAGGPAVATSVTEESADGASQVQVSKHEGGTVPGLSESVAQALADASGGSDTDTSRPDTADPSKDAKGHARTSSVKKPASFKPVSVTKSFLAKSLLASPNVRPSDKGV